MSKMDILNASITFIKKCAETFETLENIHYVFVHPFCVAQFQYKD